MFCPSSLGPVNSPASGYINCTACRWCASTARCMPSTAINTSSCPSWTSNCSTWSDPSNCNERKYCPLSGFWIGGSASTCIRGERASGCRWCPQRGQCLLNTTLATLCPNYTSPCNSIVHPSGSCNNAGLPFFCPTSLGGFYSQALFRDCYRCGQCNVSSSSTCQPWSQLNTTCSAFTGWCLVLDGNQQKCNSNFFCASSGTYGDGYLNCAGGHTACIFCPSTQRCLTGIATAAAMCPSLSESLCRAWDNSTNCNFLAFCPDFGWIDSTRCYNTCLGTCVFCGACLFTKKCVPAASLNSSSCPGYVDRCSSLDAKTCIGAWAGNRVGYCAQANTLSKGRLAAPSTPDYACDGCPGECFRCMFCYTTNVCLTGASWFNGKCTRTDPCSFFLSDAWSCSVYSLSPIGDWSSTCVADYGSSRCVSCHYCNPGLVDLSGTCRAANISCYTHSSSASMEHSTTFSNNESITNTLRVSVTGQSATLSATRSISMSNSRPSQTVHQSASTSESFSATAHSRTESGSSKSESVSESCLATLEVLNSPLMLVGPFSSNSVSHHELHASLPTADLIATGFFSINTSATRSVALLHVGNVSTNVGRVVGVSLSEGDTLVMQFELMGSDVGKVSFVNKMQLRIEVDVAATGRCVPPDYVGKFVFEWTLTPFPPRSALQRATTAVYQSSTTSSSVLGNPVTAMTTTGMISMSSLSECLFSDVDPLDPSVSLTGAAFGDSLGQYYRGGALAGICLYFGITALATIAALGLSHCATSPRSMVQAFALLRFPSKGMVVVGMFHQGLVTCSTSLIRLGGVGDFDVLLGVVSVGVSALLVAGALYITTSTRLQCRLEDVSENERNQASDETEMKEMRSQPVGNHGREETLSDRRPLSSNVAQRVATIVMWKQHWCDLSSTALYKPRYMMLIDDLRLPWWTSVELSSGLVQGIILGIRQNSVEVCRSQQLALTLHCFIIFAGASFFHPCGATLSNVFLVLSKFFSLVISLFTLLHTETLDDSMNDVAQLATTTATMLSSLQTVIQLVVTAAFAAPTVSRIGASAALRASSIATKWLRLQDCKAEDGKVHNSSSTGTDPAGEGLVLSVPLMASLPAEDRVPMKTQRHESEVDDEIDLLLGATTRMSDDSDAYLRLLCLDPFRSSTAAAAVDIGKLDNEPILLREMDDRRALVVAAPAASSVEIQKAQLFKELQIGYVPPVLKQQQSLSPPSRTVPRTSRRKRSQRGQRSVYDEIDDDDDDL